MSMVRCKVVPRYYRGIRILIIEAKRGTVLLMGTVLLRYDGNHITEVNLGTVLKRLRWESLFQPRLDAS